MVSGYDQETEPLRSGVGLIQKLQMIHKLSSQMELTSSLGSTTSYQCDLGL